MDIEKLEVFIDLVKTRNYTEVAESHYTTQGNISKQIMSLEKSLNLQLFNRNHRNIRLTEVGEIIFPYAVEIVNSYHNLCQKAIDYQNEDNSTLSIVSIPTLINYSGFNLITNFLSAHPEITLQLKEVEGSSLIDRLRESCNVIIYTRFFKWNMPNTDVFVTEEDRFVAVMSKTNSYSDRKLLSLELLKDESFLILNHSTNLKQPIIELCQSVNFEPNIVYEGTRVDLIVQMVRENMGIALLMEKTVVLDSEDTVISIPITPNKVSNLAFVKKSSTKNLAVLDFWNYLKENKNYSVLE